MDREPFEHLSIKNIESNLNCLVNAYIGGKSIIDTMISISIMLWKFSHSWAILKKNKKYMKK